MNLSFDKMHGLGNDFIVIDDFERLIELDADQVIYLCDRNFGIGADGVMLLRPASCGDADFEWWFANADGTLPEMCGNGIRCAARYLADKGHLPPDAEGLVIDTRAGLKYIELERDEAGIFKRAIVDMGTADLSSAALGTTLESNTALDIEYVADDGSEQTTTSLSIEGIIDYPLYLDELDEEVVITGASMGNPHVVIDLESLDCTIADAPVDTLGPLIENHPAFENQTNVEFIEVVDAHTLNIRVWERGCGETLACGTGACAAAVSAYLHGDVQDEVTVRLPGGDLQITIDPSNLGILMAGPAEFVYAGTIELDM